jgi:hypothetical protein
MRSRRNGLFLMCWHYVEEAISDLETLPVEQGGILRDFAPRRLRALRSAIAGAIPNPYLAGDKFRGVEAGDDTSSDWGSVSDGFPG